MWRVNRLTSIWKLSCPCRTSSTDIAGQKKSSRLKRTFLWFYNPFVTAAKDYRDVFLETGKKMTKRPIKSSIYLSLFGIVSYFWYNNPTLDHYRDVSLSNHHKLLMLSWRVRNKNSDQFVDTVRMLDREGRLAHRSFFLFSVVYHAHVNSELREFSKTFLAPRWAEYLDRIVDVGVLGRWYYMENAMLDYDINEDEWK